MVRSRALIWVVIALLSTFALGGCDDADKHPLVASVGPLVGASTTVEASTTVSDAATSVRATASVPATSTLAAESSQLLTFASTTFRPPISLQVSTAGWVNSIDDPALFEVDKGDNSNIGVFAKGMAAASADMARIESLATAKQITIVRRDIPISVAGISGTGVELEAGAVHFLLHEDGGPYEWDSESDTRIRIGTIALKGGVTLILVVEAPKAEFDAFAREAEAVLVNATIEGASGQ